jgi:AraC-like DNA-binding protein
MYQLRKPAEPLRRFVEHYWFVENGRGEPVDLRVDVFVDGRADLVFNFGAPYLREEIGGPPVEYSESNLDAQRLVPIRITQRGDVRIAGVRFHLGGLGAFARGGLREVTGRTVPPAEVLGDGAVALEAGLRGDPDPDAQARRLDGFLLGQLCTDEPFPVFARALGLLETGRVEAVAAEVGVSARQLDRMFSRYLGIAPKPLAGILRFQRALGMLMRDPGVTLADVAISAGYFDQSHFVREFKRMTGGVPRGYRGYYPPQGPRDFAPNVVAFVQDRRRSDR